MTPLSVGEQLAHARSERGLSLEQAAHATKIRPDKLAALEGDDFSAFPNNTYARGFLLIYGKFLRVDVSALASKLESANPISVQDYQYLSVPVAPEAEQRARMRPREQTQARRPSIAPLIAFIILAAIVASGIYFYMSAQRLGGLDPSNRKPVSPEEPEAVADPAPPAAANDVAAEPAVPPATDTQLAAPGEAPPVPTPPPPLPEQSRPNELSIEPVKKSWVRIRRDEPASEPVFEDFLYPGVGPLKIKGTKFFIEVRPDGEVQVRKNGQPLAYQAPGITVE